MASMVAASKQSMAHGINFQGLIQKQLVSHPSHEGKRAEGGLERYKAGTLGDTSQRKTISQHSSDRRARSAGTGD
eukprot:1158448-Pelagomonas_calceolata.AAC.1